MNDTKMQNRLFIMKQKTRGHNLNDWTCTVCGKVKQA